MRIGGPLPVLAGAAADPTAAGSDARLHKVSTQLEALFVQQMYKSMRESVPKGGVVDGGAGEEMFTGMMDEHIAADTPKEWKHGLSESIFRQLKAKVNAQGTQLPPASSPVMPGGVDD
ncbi:MAG: rod-binding protein [Gemmatimonadaceae bacterium]